jgi:hypothetical protein
LWISLWIFVLAICSICKRSLVRFANCTALQHLRSSRRYTAVTP